MEGSSEFKRPQNCQGSQGNQEPANFDASNSHSRPSLQQATVDLTEFDDQQLEAVSIVEAFEDGNNQEMFPSDIGMINN